MRQTSGLHSKQVAGNRPQDRSLTEQKDIHQRSQAVGTKQEATSEARDYLITEVSKVDVGTEATAFALTTPLLEREPEVQCPILCATAQLIPPQSFIITHSVPSHWCCDERPHSGQLKEPTHTDQALMYQ